MFLGLILDSLTLDNNFTQIPGLILCGILFGRIKLHRDILVRHFRHGLVCSFGSFLCGTLYFLQILFRNFSDGSFLLFIPGFKNILAEVFLTGLFAHNFQGCLNCQGENYNNKFRKDVKNVQKKFIFSNYLEFL